jgi:transposase
MGSRHRSTTKKGKSDKRVRALRVIRENVAGIDLGSREHWVCCPTAPQPQVRTFGTTTPELQKLADWIESEAVESVAMEATGIYWIPLYELLEARGIEVVLVNARQLSHVPGRKTDMLDCQWLQLLHSCGLLRGSFRPVESICQLRALQRERANLVQEATRAVQRMQKALDQMNVQVHRALSDLTGKTGLAMLRAMVEGERDPSRLAAFRDKRCRKSEAQIAEHLTGNWREEHLFNLKMALRLYEEVQDILVAYDREIMHRLQQLQAPERARLELAPHPNPAKEKAIKRRGEQSLRTARWRFAGVDLTRIDGISGGVAQIVLTEIGLDLQAFPSEKHFVSWLRLSPKTAFSAGKPLPKNKNKGTGATRVAGVLRMAALSLSKSASALGAYFRRIARRKGGATAVFATARKLATYIYRMLRYGQDYLDEGAQAYEQRFQQQRLASIRSFAKQMGYELVPIRAAAQVSG